MTKVMGVRQMHVYSLLSDRHEATLPDMVRSLSENGTPYTISMVRHDLEFLEG